jgi:hypothetical protein
MCPDMPQFSEPFSVPDDLADGWDDMVRRNRLIQALNDPDGGEDGQESAAAPNDLVGRLRQAQMPMTDWLSLRSDQLAAQPASDAAEADAAATAPAADFDATGADSATPPTIRLPTDADSDEAGSPVDSAFRLAGDAGDGVDDGARVPPLNQGGVGASASATAAPHDKAGYWTLGAEWLTGLGPRHHEFGPGDPATQILRQHDHIQALRERIAASPPPVGELRHDDYSLKGWQGVPEFLKDYSAVPTGGATGNLAAAYLGSYPLKYTVRNIDKDGVATVDFDATNTSSLASALHIPILAISDPRSIISIP